MHSTTFTPDIDPAKRTYNIHLIAELDAPDAELGQTAITSKDLLASLENLLTKEHGFEMVASQCNATDGEFASVVWIDDDPVPFTELVESQKLRAAFEELDYGIELYQRTDMRWDWRMLADNGNIVAGSASQGYENRQDAIEMIHKLFLGVNGVPIVITPLHSPSWTPTFNREGKIVEEGE